MTHRRRISSGGPWEAIGGYSRAIVVGDSCWVSGTTDAGPDGGSRHPGDIAGQEIEYPMAIVIMGGLICSTLLNLFVVPSLYLFLGKSKKEKVALGLA